MERSWKSIGWLKFAFMLDFYDEPFYLFKIH